MIRAQARLAGVQRLLVIAGYDANPIDGLRGNKTDAALEQFLDDRKLPADAAAARTSSTLLLDAAQRPDGVGFSWCNETPYRRDGGARHRRQGRGRHPRLVPRRGRQMRQPDLPASRGGSTASPRRSTRKASRS